jgi:hypothetical protein
MLAVQVALVQNKLSQLVLSNMLKVYNPAVIFAKRQSHLAECFAPFSSAVLIGDRHRVQVIFFICQNTIFIIAP